MRVLIDGNVEERGRGGQEGDVRQFSAEELVQGSVLSADEATTARVGQTRRVLAIFWGLIAVAAAGIASLAGSAAASCGETGARRYRDWRHCRRCCSRRAYFPLVDAGHRAGRAGQTQHPLPHDVHSRPAHAGRAGRSRGARSGPDAQRPHDYRQCLAADATGRFGRHGLKDHDGDPIFCPGPLRGGPRGLPEGREALPVLHLRGMALPRGQEWPTGRRAGMS